MCMLIGCAADDPLWSDTFSPEALSHPVVTTTTTVPVTTTSTTTTTTTSTTSTTTTTVAAVFWENVERWRPTVTEAVFAWGGNERDVHRFLRIMQCESGGLPDAKNPNSSASGLMQHLTRFWPERATAAGMPGADVFDPYANIWVSAYLALAMPGGGWSHWVCK